MKIVIPSFTLYLLVFCAGCLPSGQEIEPVTFSVDSIVARSKFCGDQPGECTRATAVVPVAFGGDGKVSKRINDSISVHGSALIGFGDDTTSDTRLAIFNFVQEYDSFVEEEGGDYPFVWECEQIGKVLYQTDSLASISIYNYSYSGGAHPNAQTELLNFHLGDGRMLEYRDVVLDRPAFLDLADKYFRRSRNLGLQDDLQEAGFFYNGEFTLPDNFAITAEGILLFYNSYEVAAYSLGPTEFVIPWADLAGIAVEGDWVPQS